jgi:hypothetical protein
VTSSSPPSEGTREGLGEDVRAHRRSNRHATYLQSMRAALAAVVPGVAADVERRTLDRCADELRAALNPWPEQPIATLTALADSWGAPADDERQR